MDDIFVEQKKHDTRELKSSSILNLSSSRNKCELCNYHIIEKANFEAFDSKHNSSISKPNVGIMVANNPEMSMGVIPVNNGGITLSSFTDSFYKRTSVNIGGNLVKENEFAMGYVIVHEHFHSLIQFSALQRALYLQNLGYFDYSQHMHYKSLPNIMLDGQYIPISIISSKTMTSYHSLPLILDALLNEYR